MNRYIYILLETIANTRMPIGDLFISVFVILVVTIKDIDHLGPISRN